MSLKPLWMCNIYMNLFNDHEMESKRSCMCVIGRGAALKTSGENKAWELNQVPICELEVCEMRKLWVN